MASVPILIVGYENKYVAPDRMSSYVFGKNCKISVLNTIFDSKEALKELSYSLILAELNHRLGDSFSHDKSIWFGIGLATQIGFDDLDDQISKIKEELKFSNELPSDKNDMENFKIFYHNIVKQWLSNHGSEGLATLIERVNSSENLKDVFLKK